MRAASRGVRYAPLRTPALSTPLELETWGLRWRAACLAKVVRVNTEYETPKKYDDSEVQPVTTTSSPSKDLGLLTSHLAQPNPSPSCIQRRSGPDPGQLRFLANPFGLSGRHCPAARLGPLLFPAWSGRSAALVICSSASSSLRVPGPLALQSCPAAASGLHCISGL